MLKSFFRNAGNPKNISGRFFIQMMNLGHQSMLIWMQKFFDIPYGSTVLDIGCGGGRNIANLLKIAPESVFYGLDISSLSIKKSKRLNRRAVSKNKAHFLEGSVESIPFKDNTFEVITASETIYFWPNLKQNFKEVYRVLKPGGTFVICQEISEAAQAQKWLNLVEGMKFYSGKEISTYMNNTGFKDITLNTHENGRIICVVGQK